MALFADEGSSNESGGVAASFGVRDLVWRPGSLIAPVGGGWLMSAVGMDWVFYLGALAAFSASSPFCSCSCTPMAVARLLSGSGILEQDVVVILSSPHDVP